METMMRVYEPPTRRVIPGFPGYLITDDGLVFNRHGRQRKTHRSKKGYWRISLPTDRGRRSYYIHTLVLLAYTGPRPEGMEARHLDGNKDNNHASNLAWGAKSENVRDTIEHGNHPFASRTHCPQGHKLTPIPKGKGSNRRECRQCKNDYRKFGKISERKAI